MRTPIAGAVFCLALTITSGAGAATDRVAVVPFDGPGGDRAQTLVGAALPSDCKLVPGPEVKRALERSGGRLDTPEAFAALAQAVGAAMVVDGQVQRDVRWRLKIQLRKGSNGALSSAFNRSGARYKDLLGVAERDVPRWMKVAVRRLAMTTAPVVATSDPPAPPPSEVQARGRTEEPPVEVAAPRATSPEPVWEVSVGPRLISRSFTYTDNVSGLPGHTLGAAAAVVAEGELYPLAGRASFARVFGFAARFETALGARTTALNGGSLSTTALAYRFGPRYRLSQGTYLVVGGLDYGVHRFEMEAGDGSVISPNVSYSFLRPSLTGRFDAGGGVSLSLTLAYLHILNVGDMDDTSRFPRITAVGAEASAAVGYALDRDIELRLIGDLRHYAHAMHVRDGDPLIVGGAVDEHFGAALVISYRSR